MRVFRLVSWILETGKSYEAQDRESLLCQEGVSLY